MSESTTTTIQEAFTRQRETALRLRTSTAAERIAKLVRLRDAVIARREAWYRAGDADFRKPPGEVDLAEIVPVVVAANNAIRHLRGWMRPQHVWPTAMLLGTRSHLRHEPRGRCLIISPWNYPLNLCLSPLVSAIAAGNTVIIKPSELTPAVSAEVKSLIAEIFTPDEVTVFEGDASVAQALLELPFDHIFFTGSPAVGRLVMAAAAKHLTTVTLELGGKTPVVVDATADLDLAAQVVMWSKCNNAGQTCVAPDHLYIHASVKDAFVTRCRAQLEAAYGASQPAPGTTHLPSLAHVVNRRHTARIKGLLDDAKARGAHVLTGGEIAEDERFVPPTLLDNVDPASDIMQHEIFGPLLPIIPYTELNTVIDHINAGPKPLALYIHSRDQANIEALIGRTSTGGVCVNHAMIQYVHGNLPFGGVNESGMGTASGWYGFRSFSHERAIVRTQVDMAAKLFKAGEVPEGLRRLLWRILRWV